MSFYCTENKAEKLRNPGVFFETTIKYLCLILLSIIHRFIMNKAEKKTYYVYAWLVFDFEQFFQLIFFVYLFFCFFFCCCPYLRMQFRNRLLLKVTIPQLFYWPSGPGDMHIIAEWQIQKTDRGPRTKCKPNAGCIALCII